MTTTEGDPMSETDRGVGGRDAFDPWAQRIYALTMDIRKHCESLPDTELAALIEKAERATSTNCGWATYDVAGMALREARVVRGRRRNEAARTEAIR